MYDPKADETREQQLKVQRLVFRGAEDLFWSSNSPAIVVPVNLGRATNFAILANSTITNTGSSVVTGDLGLYPGTSVTGFPPGTVIGTEHITDTAAQNAETDAAAAYSALAGNTFTSIPAVLDGQTLSPGYYTEGSSTFSLAGSGPGTLTLDAGGNPNALFVFKASSTLVTGAGGIPTIVLANGAVAANVFWLIGSSATLNSGTAGTFYGTVLATTSITDTMGGVINGRLFAINGAVTLSAATVLNGIPAAGVGQLLVHIRESVQNVYLVSCHVDIANMTINVNNAEISIVDSTTGLPGGDQNDILINGIGPLATNDCLTVHYQVVL
jgi:hypothetical protein